MNKRGCERESKKAQASLIIIVLLILIVIVAVLIIWNVIIPLVKERGKEAETRESVMTVNLDIKEVILFEIGGLWVTVNRKAGKGEVEELRFVFYDEQGNQHVETGEALAELETRTYEFSPVPELGKIKSVSVFPVVDETAGLEANAEVKDSEVPKSLVSWWRFENTEETGKDSVGFNDGISYNVELVDGRGGKAAKFNGGSYINVMSHESLNVNEKLAISFWIKTNSVEGEIIKKGSNYGVSLDLGGKIVFSYDGFEQINGISVNDDEWHHVVVSGDSGGISSIYVDTGWSSIEISDLEISQENVTIGKGFNGLIDDLMFFNESLTYTQVEDLFDNQKK